MAKHKSKKNDLDKWERILWDLKNSNKLSNPSDPGKKAERISKVERIISQLKKKVS